MSSQKTYQPFFSVIIPLKKGSGTVHLYGCLDALRKQSFQNFDILLVTDTGTKQILEKKIPDYKSLHWLTGSFSKPQARNEGTKISTGKYLIHIDADYVLHPATLEECKKAIDKKKAAAIIIPETIQPSDNIFKQARILERDILADDLDLATPQVIERKLLQNIQGFDEQVGDLDDWGLFLKLKIENVRFEKIQAAAFVYEPVNPIAIWRHRFRKGQYLPLLKERYKHLPQTNFSARLLNNYRKIPLLLKKPQVTLSLGILKICDSVPFFLGTLFPKKSGLILSNPYEEKRVAGKFDKEQISKKGLYKNYREIQLLTKLLTKPKGTILELGAGTGRVTKQLTELGYTVTPTDVSEAMLQELHKKNGLPSPIFIKNSSELPFKNKSFDSVFAYRVIWHIMDNKKRDEFFSEAARVAKKTLILDLTNKNKYQNPFIKHIITKRHPTFFANTYYYTWDEIEQLARINQLHITKVLKLEVISPYIYTLLPISIIKLLLPAIAKIEDIASLFMQPGRFLVQFTHEV